MHTLVCAALYLFTFLWIGGIFSSELIGTRKQQVLSEGHCCLSNSGEGTCADCTKRNLTTVPGDLPNDTVILNLSHNWISELFHNSFHGHGNLLRLNVAYNRLIQIENGTFSSLKHLQVLNLSYNRLTEFQGGWFHAKINLETLPLTQTNLTSMPRATSAESPKLTQLTLSANRIQSLHFDPLSRWDNISIDLSENNLSSIQKHDFLPLKNCLLSSLVLSRNKRLHHLGPMVFSGLPFVSSILLHRNSIKKLEVLAFMGKANITTLSLHNSSIEEIIPVNKSAYNFSFPNIKIVDLTGNAIQRIPEFAFWGLNQMHTLIVRENRVCSIQNTSFCSLDDLQVLDLSKNHITSLPSGAFHCNKHLLELLLSDNKIMRLHSASFKELISLLHLNLSYNLLESSQDKFPSMPSLVNLDLCYNKMTRLTKNLFRGLSRLQYLNMSNNDIESDFNSAFASTRKMKELVLTYEKNLDLHEDFRTLDKLQKLNLSHSPLTMNSTDQFHGTASLTMLDMSFTNLQSKHLFDSSKRSSLFLGLKSLEQLLLQGNNFLNKMVPGTFHPLSKLKILDISKSKIKVIKAKLFDRLTHLTSLRLHGNQLVELNTQILCGLQQLRSLFVQDNLIQSIPVALFNSTPNLSKIFMSQNHVSTVVPGTVFPRNVEIDLSNNPILCSCELAWFRTLLDTNNIALVHANKTVCGRTSTMGAANKPLLQFHPEELCTVSLAMPIVTTFLVLIVLSLLCVLAYRKRWWLRNKVCLMKMAIRGYEDLEEHNADSYQYQLNVMFNDADAEWINGTMKPAMEERFPYFRNVLWADSYLNTGMHYVDAIYNAMEISYKTILVLSNQSVADTWFTSKVRMALEHLNETRLDRVTLIFLEEISDDQLPYLVRLLLNANRATLMWAKNTDRQDLFWEQFRHRHVREEFNYIPIESC
ncbi:uncharacterized protein [Diadema setosum]|uniref:uncharacterized protein n=1 Tax=Diadema setosum TaxID=31175 RepID=UPI003B3B24E9